MNSLQRIATAIALQKPDRVPVIAQVFGHAAALAGVPLDEYVRDGATLARCQLAAWKRYGYDAVFAVMDVNVETEAIGSILATARISIRSSNGTSWPSKAMPARWLFPIPNGPDACPRCCKRWASCGANLAIGYWWLAASSGP